MQSTSHFPFGKGSPAWTMPTSLDARGSMMDSVKILQMCIGNQTKPLPVLRTTTRPISRWVEKKWIRESTCKHPCRYKQLDPCEFSAKNSGKGSWWKSTFLWSPLIECLVLRSKKTTSKSNRTIFWMLLKEKDGSWVLMKATCRNWYKSLSTLSLVKYCEPVFFAMQIHHQESECWTNQPKVQEFHAWSAFPLFVVRFHFFAKPHDVHKLHGNHCNVVNYCKLICSD